MPISPEDITGKEFFGAPNGYERDEVRAYLSVIAADQRALVERIESLESRQDGFSELGAETAAVLQRAHEIAERVTHEARVMAVQTRERAEDDAQILRDETAAAAEKLRQEAEDYAYEVRTAAERGAREQHTLVAERVGRLLAGESTVRERLYSLEITLQALRGELSEAAETVLPELSRVPPRPPLTETSAEVGAEEAAPVIDLRDENVAGSSNGASRS